MSDHPASAASPGGAGFFFIQSLGLRVVTRRNSLLKLDFVLNPLPSMAEVTDCPATISPQASRPYPDHHPPSVHRGADRQDPHPRCGQHRGAEDQEREKVHQKKRELELDEERKRQCEIDRDLGWEL